MILSSLVVAWIQSGICLIFGLLMLKVLCRNLVAKIFAARATLAMALVLFLVSPFVSTRTSPVVPIDLSADSRNEWKDLTVMAAPSTTKVLPAADIPVSQSSPSPLSDPSLLLITVYLAGLIAALGLQMAGAWALTKIRKGSEAISNGPIFDKLIALSARLGVDTPMIAESPSGMTPFVAGIRRKAVFLPTYWLEQQSPEVVDSVLEHEIAHIAGRDLEWFFAARTACSILWCQPAAWLVYRELQRAAEERCDQEAVLSGVPPEQYAQALVAVQERFSRTQMVGNSIGTVKKGSSLTVRIEAILAGVPYRRVLSRRTKVSLFAFVFASSALSAALIAQPPRPRLDSPQVSVAGNRNAPSEPADGALRTGSLVGDFKPKKLKDGSSVSLEFLYLDEGGKLVAWLPDGKPRKLERSEIAEFNQSGPLGMVRGLIRITGAPTGQRPYSLRNLDGIPAVSGFTNYDLSSHSAKIWIRVFKEKETGAFEVGAPVGDYKDWRKPELVDPTRIIKDELGNPTITIPFPSELTGKDISILGTNSTGKSWSVGRNITNGDPSKPGVTVLQLVGFKPSELKTFQIRYRDIQWVRFTGVHLTPDSE